MRDDLDDLLGIDTDDPEQRLALDLVKSDRHLLLRLVALRGDRGLTQAEVGRRMGTTQPAVAAFERADADPKLSTIRRYALAVGASVQHSVTSRISSGSSVVSRVTRSVTDSSSRSKRVKVEASSSLLSESK
ncbi:helix-turn-helix domain-containing protein [Amycolatopsis cihanbeyliensis]|uniref:helix-turn-helix domain-containing protein n=1 Tax=Amycolatopsis cihanbeyliensis TaxID=1128664 RepID=UPI00114F4971